MFPVASLISALALAVMFATSFSALVVPYFADLTIRTRITVAGNVTARTTWYFKGPRQRLEQASKSSLHTGVVVITQCDQKSEIILDEQKKTYVRRPVEELAGKMHELTKPTPDAVDVIITMNSIDTGERRSLGNYEARRVKTTITTDANDEAGVQASTMEIDGWVYRHAGLELPG